GQRRLLEIDVVPVGGMEHARVRDEFAPAIAREVEVAANVRQHALERVEPGLPSLDLLRVVIVLLRHRSVVGQETRERFAPVELDDVHHLVRTGRNDRFGRAKRAERTLDRVKRKPYDGEIRRTERVPSEGPTSRRMT